MGDEANVLIAGGGIIGSALAWALAERGVDGIVVVDLDLSGMYASSELNAGGARATWWQPVNIATCAATLDFFRQHAKEFSFRQHGYLWLYDDESKYKRARYKITLQDDFDLGVQAIDAREIPERFPWIDRGLDEIIGATFSPKDGLVNPNAVRNWYRKNAENKGVRFLNRHYLEGVSTENISTPGGSQRRVRWVDIAELEHSDPLDQQGVIKDLLTHHVVPLDKVVRKTRIRTESVVNCLGAWSPIFSAKIGVHDVTEPTRRQISMLDVQLEQNEKEMHFAALGMVVDPSDVYFHPEGSSILAGYSIPQEPPGFDFRYEGTRFFEEYIWPKLAHRSSAFEHSKHLRGWAGLYAVTPDCSGIAGQIKGFSNLYEAHSFTGRGVMQSYGIASAMAELINTGKSSELDISPLTRERFSDPQKWLVEDLHI